MATPEEIAAFRLLIAAPDNVDPYTDDALSDRLDAATSQNALAAIIWREKAAHYSSLVDVTESGSSRRMGQLHENALKMAKAFDVPAEEDDSPGPLGGIAIHRLTRR